MAGIYLHLPYCHAKCAYCDFYSTPDTSTLAQLPASIAREWEARSAELGGEKVGTIYFGGGTPSILHSDMLESLLGMLPVDQASEITIEVNPEDVTEEFARWLAQSAFNRVSMGVQSLDDGELKAVGRRHTARQAIEAAERLRNAGIGNLSLDLIFGLPGQTVASWKRSLRRVLDLRPAHLSAYSLMVEPGTRIYARLNAGKLTLPAQQINAEMYDLLCTMTADYGMEHYEISNYALPGYRSAHNSAYWNLTPYLGLGPSAHSFTQGVRSFNPNSVKEYIANPLGRTIEHLTPGEHIDEYLLIRLRTLEGLDLEKFRAMFGTEETDRLLKRAAADIRSGRLETSDNYLRIPQKHWLVSDPIIIDLMCD